ncbi:MAG TPA: hypothetical protein VHV50_04295 [Actinomycetota bacterium]|nr:hypothetical protein [Actinomycetota bacterium]
MTEGDLRTMLTKEAAGFHPDPAWLAGARRRPRFTRNLIAVVGIAAIVVAAALYGLNTDRAALQPRSSAHPVYIRLAGYEAKPGGSLPGALRRHIACMRNQGFKLPDPVRVRGGWALKISDPRSIGLGSRRWKRAAFDTCALVRDRTTYNRWIRRAILHPRSLKAR